MLFLLSVPVYVWLVFFHFFFFFVRVKDLEMGSLGKWAVSAKWSIAALSWINIFFSQQENIPRCILLPRSIHHSGNLSQELENALGFLNGSSFWVEVLRALSSLFLYTALNISSNSSFFGISGRCLQCCSWYHVHRNNFRSVVFSLQLHWQQVIDDQRNQ